MRKILLLTVLLLVGFSTYAQNITNIAYSPNVAEFVNKSGDYLIKDIYPIDKSKLELKVVILTDFETKEKIGYLDYTSENTSSNMTSALLGGVISYYTSSIDYDEIQLCIDCLEYARENLLGTKPDAVISAFYYTTKGRGRFGVKWQDWDRSNGLPSSWRVFVNADPLGRVEFEKSANLSGRAADKIIEALKTAKTLIEEKTK